jgi:hypothetical protein
MGTYNSSKTRVVPVFDQLFAEDPSGAAWLDGLMRTGSRAVEVSLAEIRPHLVDGHPPTWGRAELALPAPLPLLEHLVQTIALQQVAKSRDKGSTREKREALARRDPSTIAEALQALRRGSRGRNWYVLEGASKPDATLIMDDAVLVIEGKRTERSCTSLTTWMGARSQLVRHMDAAMERFPAKRILGLLLVEGDGGAEAITPSPHWIAETKAQYECAMLASSLPHRSPTERSLIAAGILGVATWQEVCKQNRIPWPPVQHPL